VLELTGTRTELDLANRLSVYGYVEEHTMRDGHVWCIGSAREREKAGDEGASHSSRGQRASSQKMGRKDGMLAKAGRSRVSRAEPGSAGGARLRWRSPAPLWAPPGHLGSCHVAGMAVPDCSLQRPHHPSLKSTLPTGLWHARTVREVHKSGTAVTYGPLNPMRRGSAR
jgi:hypothetical protein